MSNTSRAASPSRSATQVSLARPSSQNHNESSDSLNKWRAANVSTPNALKRARAATEESARTIRPSLISREDATSVSRLWWDPSKVSLTGTNRKEAWERDLTMRFSKGMQEKLEADDVQETRRKERLTNMEKEVRWLEYAQAIFRVYGDTSQTAPPNQEIEWPEWVHDEIVDASSSRPLHEASQ